MLSKSMQSTTMPDKPVIFIMGPTASGKTDLAIELCQQYPMEIISVDSALIYQNMNIGTAMPSEKELALAPHALVNFLSPTESYSVGSFRKDALKLIDEIHQRNHIPLLVGGTMLYHRALLYGLSDLPTSDPSIRTYFEDKMKTEGLPSLHQQLMQCDPISGKKIHPNDPQRIIRALEVFQISGKPLSQLIEESKQTAISYPIKKIIIAPSSRELLRERIKTRYLQMIEHGFIEEVESLYQRSDMHADLPSMRCVGYRQVWEYLDKQVTYDEMIENGVTITRQFAKRQMTWLRKEKDALWLETGDKSNMDKLSGHLADLI